ncbi:LPS export ABC transporter permease LptG [Telmatospirillum sp. J64-1]|uniref:LPS export ABC transporter permease LptG n=1 Tax=Telmatospirillum sp. J64-1 TaxID=2502183 RepID=UPI00115DF7D8|nr:LPS export ABC transporter permease LptG [Telmatospirillum sp. J64-1]
MNFSPILTRYISRNFLVSFLTLLLLVMGLILLFEVIDLLRRASGSETATFGAVLAMSLLKAPQTVQMVLPFAVMLGAMVTFWRLTRSHELVVARSIGVSAWQFLTPVLLLSLVIGVINVAAINPLAATFYTKFDQLQSQYLSRNNSLQVGRGGLWLREGQPDGTMAVVQARTVRQDGLTLQLDRVTIYRLDSRDRFLSRIDAESGKLVPGHFDLEEAVIYHPGNLPEPHDSLRLPTSLTLSRIQDNFAKPEALSFWELPGFIEFFESAGFSAHKHRMYYYSLLASPFLLCSMVLIAAVFSLKPNQRGGGVMRRVMGGVAAGFLIYFFSRLIYVFGLSESLPLLLAAWSPVLVTGMIGMAMLFHLEDG